MVEVMIVVVIVGILASVSVPIYRGNIRRAMSSEGTALLGCVLTMQHVYFSEHGTYAQNKSDLMIDLVGQKYFTDYAVLSADKTGFTAETRGWKDAAGIVVRMDYTRPGGARFTLSGL